MSNKTLFLAHGVHLAVMDVLYKKHVDEEDDDKGSEPSDEEEVDEEVEMDEVYRLEEHPGDELLPDFSDNFHEIFTNIRYIVKSFRHERR